MEARPTEVVLQRLAFRDLEVRASGISWMAQCPSHEDSQPSLRVSEGDDGRALLFCLAGCRPAQIVADLGMDLRDLFVPRERDAGPLPAPRLVPTAGGTMATRAERDVIEAELREVMRQSAESYVPGRRYAHEHPRGERDWDRMWAILAEESRREHPPAQAKAPEVVLGVWKNDQ